MIDKNIIKNGLNDRLREIYESVELARPKDFINEVIAKYSEELKHYKYIDSVELFSTLAPRGHLRYISKYDKKLRWGGLLIKIYSEDGYWYGIVRKTDGKKYHVAFEKNYIFYTENKEDKFIAELSLFIKDTERDLYEII